MTSTRLNTATQTALDKLTLFWFAPPEPEFVTEIPYSDTPFDYGCEEQWPEEMLGYDDLCAYGDGRDYDTYCQSAWGL